MVLDVAGSKPVARPILKGIIMDDLILPQNPTLSDFQAYIEKMKKLRGFNTTDPILEMLFLTEEIGEVATIVRRTSQQGHFDINKIKDLDISTELADVFMFLLSLCNMYGVDLEEAFRKKEEKNKTRIWKKTPHDL